MAESYESIIAGQTNALSSETLKPNKNKRKDPDSDESESTANDKKQKTTTDTIPPPVPSNSIIYQPDAMKKVNKFVLHTQIQPDEWHMWIYAGAMGFDTYTNHEGKECRNYYLSCYRTPQSLKGTPFENEEFVDFKWYILGARSSFPWEVKNFDPTKKKTSLSFTTSFSNKHPDSLKIQALLEGRDRFLKVLSKTNEDLKIKRKEGYSVKSCIKPGKKIERKKEETPTKYKPKEGKDQPPKPEYYDSSIHFDVEWCKETRKYKFNMFNQGQLVNLAKDKAVKEFVESKDFKAYPCNVGIHTNRIKIVSQFNNIRFNDICVAINLPKPFVEALPDCV